MAFKAVKTESYLGLPERITGVAIKFTKPFGRLPRRLLNSASVLPFRVCLKTDREAANFMNHEGRETRSQISKLCY